MNNNYYKKGDYNITCDICGQKFKRSQCKRQWDNLITCKPCWSPKHPYLNPIPVLIDGLPVPNARPRPRSRYVNPGAGYDRWGSPYLQGDTLVPNVVWGSWDRIWGGSDQSTDLPLR